AARGHRSALGHGRRPRSPTFPAVCILAHPSAPTPMRRLLLFILPFLAASALAQAPAVAPVTPANGRTLVALDTPVTVAFDRAVDPASVTPATFRVFGRWSGPMPGALAFEDGNTRVVFTPATPF